MVLTSPVHADNFNAPKPWHSFANCLVNAVLFLFDILAFPCVAKSTLLHLWTVQQLFVLGQLVVVYCYIHANFEYTLSCSANLCIIKWNVYMPVQHCECSLTMINYCSPATLIYRTIGCSSTNKSGAWDRLCL